MILDSNGIQVNLGDKVRGEGVLTCNGNYQIDLTTIVTVREIDGIIYFGGLSMSSFRNFWKVSKNDKPKLNF